MEGEGKIGRGGSRDGYRGDRIRSVIAQLNRLHGDRLRQLVPPDRFLRKKVGVEGFESLRPLPIFFTQING